MSENPTERELDDWTDYVETALDRIGRARTERTAAIRAGRTPETVDPAFGLWVDESIGRVRQIAGKIGATNVVGEFNDRDPDTVESVYRLLLARLHDARSA